VPWSDLSAGPGFESSATVRARVVAAREMQLARQACLNSQLSGRLLEQIARLDDHAAAELLGQSVARLELSARAVTRVRRVARTLADLSGSSGIRAVHIAEAVHFRLPQDGPAS
jgi:magnesium chelatase family protein